MREKLIELLITAPHLDVEDQTTDWEEAAAYLIANGVTVCEKGEWLESMCLDDCFWVCSNCRFQSEATAAPQLYKYCPNCGADMRGGT